MTTQQGNLRHRKKAGSSRKAAGPPEVHQPNRDDANKDNTKSEHDDNGLGKTRLDPEEDSGASAFRLTPLVQRALWQRLDVFPFVLIYIVLVRLDHHPLAHEQQEQLLFHIQSLSVSVSSLVTLLWGMMLCLHLIIVLWTQWSVLGQARMGYFLCSTATTKTNNKSSNMMAQWTHCLVQSAQPGMDGSTVAGIVPIQKEADTSAAVVTVKFQDRVFRCCAAPPDLDSTLWNTTSTTSTTASSQRPASSSTTSTSPTTSALLFRPVQYPIHRPLSFYATAWSGHATLESCVAAGRVYGRNSTALQLPAFRDLLAEQLVAPFFLFQMVCVALWSLDEYWYYALFTLFALLLFESTVAFSRRKGLERLHLISQKHQHQRVWVRRGQGQECRTIKNTNDDSKNETTTTTTLWQWMSIPVGELVPGDWISLAGYHIPVPADILLLRGTAVCDEALLTGESVPQLKQPLDVTVSPSSSSFNIENECCLDLQQHKESILFGGTELVVATPPDESDINNNDSMEQQQQQQQEQHNKDIPPDQGVTGMVLRTGFETAQGNLLRTMAHSSHKADGVHTLDTFVFILILVACAVVAATHVLQHGWYDERRNRFRLVLHVIMIVTSVVPPELPMELSLAITNSVQALMHRCQVYCSEHFRIAWAGQVTVCCFDKTGTLTSDEMRLRGVRLFSVPPSLSLQQQQQNTTEQSENIDREDAALIHPDNDVDRALLPWTTVRIMAACHSLAIAANERGRVQVIGDSLEQAVMKHTGFGLRGNNWVVPLSETTVVESSRSITVRPIHILHRFAFSSKLKRMTVLVTEEGANGTVWALIKGAPETIKEFLEPSSVPEDYDEVSFHHMSRGRRVLALAYREMGNVRHLQSLKDGGRDPVERSGLVFAGFLVLDCPLKSDSKSVITELKKSGHNCVMITGDAILTAAEVARQVGIIKRSSATRKRTVYRIQERISEEESGDLPVSDPIAHFECAPFGRNVDDGVHKFQLSRSMIRDLLVRSQEGEASFCISGDTLVALAHYAVQKDGLIPTHLRSSTMDETNLLLSPAAQSILKQLVPIISVFARHAPHQKEAVVAAFNHGGSQTLMCGDGTNDVGALKRAHVGISIISAPGVESKQAEANEKVAEAKAEQKLNGKSKKTKSKKLKAASLEQSLRLLQEAQEELDRVELGDASVAAPFTSRAVSIKCCKDVIQQGRCTLVTMLQIYKILGINCLVNALVLSKLFLHGVKQGDRQLTILGIVVAALFYFVTRAEPLSTLSPIRPPASVLCTQAFVSITSQFVLHLITILIATEAALSFVDPFDPSLVPDGPFNPNVLNTCAFLFTCLATINTFAVNYRGRPFMKDLRENKLFFRSLQVCYAVLAMCALEVFPPLNDLLQLTTLPSVSELTMDDSNPLHSVFKIVDFPIFMCGLMAINTLLAFLFERTIRQKFESGNS